ncbi:MAG: hypothetical protein ACYCZV_03020 [Acidimicrobiales bacterium]
MTDLRQDPRDILVETPGTVALGDPVVVSLSHPADPGEAHRMATDELAELVIDRPTGPDWYADLRSDAAGAPVEAGEEMETGDGFFAGLEGVTHTEPQWRRGDDDVIGSAKPSRAERRQVLRLRRRAD